MNPSRKPHARGHLDFHHGLLEGAFDAAEPLADFPLTGRIVPELDREDFREVLYGAYRIIYRVFAGEKIVVLTVRHGRQLLSRDDVEG